MIREKISRYSRGILVFVVGMTLLTGALLSSGCTATGKDPVTGTWDWSDGKGYTERYIFNADHSFSAQALGSEFNGTWMRSSPDHYQIVYTNRNDTAQKEIFTEQVHYDSITDEIYFPPHQRVA